MKVRPFGLPDTSEFHLYAESMRMDGLAGNSEELAGNLRAVIKKVFLTIAQDSQRSRGEEEPDTKTYKREITSTSSFAVRSLHFDTARLISITGAARRVACLQLLTGANLPRRKQLTLWQLPRPTVYVPRRVAGALLSG